MWLKGLKKKERERVCTRGSFFKKRKKERKKNACLWKMKNGEKKKKNSNINNKGKYVRMVFDG